ncbi:YcaO-like family protein [Archangium sp.]|uniref:YcaO-like family protein n=1 Tax=Archangium sp. TaxID=1872627 RepID=UPI002D3D4B10|nr:YcaO-like family protein [Archangium sp.]HYO51407.1 YcaO-like family protein [Archangium sp.]
MTHRLKSAPKAEGIHRTVHPEQTLERVRPLMAQIGVTRLADITGLDRLGIPTWSAVVPRSRDILSVYNGKGATHIRAKVGAIMEAAERHAGLHYQREFLRGAYNELSKQRRVLAPAQSGIPLHPHYMDDAHILWTEGHCLYTGEPVLVPAELAGYNIEGVDTRCYAVTTSNGLASGNTYEEAVAHALCELIERDAWTLAEVLAHWLPRARFERQRAQQGLPPVQATPEGEQPFFDDGERFPVIDLSLVQGPILDVMGQFEAAGLPLHVRDITSDFGIPTVVASVTEQVSPDMPRAHLGVGTHPDARAAILRAMTEAAQARVVDIQGVREDMSTAEEETHHYMAHAKRVAKINKRSWIHMDAQHKRALSEMPTYDHRDVLDDIRLMLSRLKSAGVEQVIEVDITHPGTRIPVTRVIVPELENWAAIHGRIGKRAANAWRANI